MGSVSDQDEPALRPILQRILLYYGEHHQKKAGCPFRNSMNIQYPAVAISLDRVRVYNDTSQMNPHMRQTITYLKILLQASF